MRYLPLHFLERNTKGFSLIELMVAMALGLTVVLAIATLSLNSARSYRSMERAGQLIENGRFAINTLSDSAEHAGYFGNLTLSNLSKGSASTVPTHPCDIKPQDFSTWAVDKDFLFPIVAYRNRPDVQDFPTECVLKDDSIIENTDVLVIRRAETSSYIWLNSLNDWCLLEPGKLAISTDPCGTSPKRPLNGVYLQTKPLDYKFDIKDSNSNKNVSKEVLDLTKPDGTTPEDIRRYHIDIYYLVQEKNIPTLRKFNLLTGDPQPIIDGIESMQIQFGIDNNSDGSPDTFQSPLTLSSDILSSDAVTIRINLLARSLDTDSEYTDDKAYILDPENDLVSSKDNYRRRVFSQTIRIANVSGRRE